MRKSAARSKAAREIWFLDFLGFCSEKMEFAFDVRGVLPDAVTRVSKDQLPGLRNNQSRDERSQQLATIVNKLGAASAKAQGLRVAVTTYQKLMASSHTLYLLRDDCEQPVVVGLLKVGRKKLFLQDLLGVQRETEPLCVLDFYIHEARQRAGLGRRLFQTMLDIERVTAAELAIDRPSAKFLSFLRKHYGLHFHVKQVSLLHLPLIAPHPSMISPDWYYYRETILWSLVNFFKVS
jgi:alpha-tubulin N-acetyltransferase 1